MLLTQTPLTFTTEGTPIPPTTGESASLQVTTCSGDCDGGGDVDVGELMHCIKGYLGRPICDPAEPQHSCPVADANNNGAISFGEISGCANRFLNGC